jgi:glycosyltransferase involved in cell wall biosynthesis
MNMARATATHAAVPETTLATRMGPQVLQVVLSLSPGGTERLVIELSKRLHGTHGMHVCCLDAPGAWAEELTSRGISVTALGRPPGFSPGVGPQIARIASIHDATVLHCHQYSPFVYGTLARLWRPMDVVYTEHGRFSDAPPSMKRQMANRLLSRFRSRVFSVSNDLRGHLTGEGFPERQVQVIHNGIYMQAAPGPAARREARRRLGVEPEHVVIGSVGRLDPVKDFPTMVRAFHDVRRVLPQSRLVIIGDGPERPTLGAEIVRLGLTDSVVMTGHREDVASLLPALDIYANSSIFEGVSLTILEAMAAALPVVATRVGGTPEVVLEGETGRLVPARDARIMAKVLLNLASDADTAKRMGANARRRVERHFSIQQMVDRYAAVYRDSRGR